MTLPLRQSLLEAPETQLDRDLRRAAAFVRRQREALAEQRTDAGGGIPVAP
jgi:hypothetical protein